MYIYIYIYPTMYIYIYVHIIRYLFRYLFPKQGKRWPIAGLLAWQTPKTPDHWICLWKDPGRIAGFQGQQLAKQQSFYGFFWVTCWQTHLGSTNIPTLDLMLKSQTVGPSGNLNGGFSSQPLFDSRRVMGDNQPTMMLRDWSNIAYPW